MIKNHSLIKFIDECRTILKPMSLHIKNKMTSKNNFENIFMKIYAEKLKTLKFDKKSIEKDYVLRYRFKTKNSSDIKYSLLKVAENSINRKNGKTELMKYIKDDFTVADIEKGIFEFSLINVTINKLQDHFVSNIYDEKLYDLCSNLDTTDKNVDNQTLLPTIINNAFSSYLYFVAFLSPEQLHPKRWSEIIVKRQLQDDTVNNLQTTDIYQCRKCKERKFKITRLQLRCADESENVFYTCMVCYTTFIK